jgi:D-alanyl-D-alanine carboxypeptidase
VPASNTKLFTTAVSLSLLGPDYEICTKLFTQDKNINNGVINGNLYIKGYGNGTFTTDDIDILIDQLKSKNVNRITGNIIGDDTYFDDEYFREEGIEDEGTTVKLPPISALVINRNHTVEYKKIKRRRKTITRAYVKFINDPPFYIAGVLRKKLVDSGIQVDGISEKGETPAKAAELASCSIMLKDLITQINKHSDNYLAECLFKIIGAASTGEQGTAFNSAQTIHNFLDANAIFSDGTKIVDGSGISKYNRITVGSIVGLLEKMYLDIKKFDYFYNSLSIAGVDGTLDNRMIGTAAENNFHGKTGTLSISSSISGYLKTKNGDDLIISMIFQFSKGRNRFYRSIEDKIIKTIAEYEGYTAK